MWDDSSDAVSDLSRVTEIEVGVMSELECQCVQRVIHQDALPHLSRWNYVSVEQKDCLPVSIFQMLKLDSAVVPISF